MAKEKTTPKIKKEVTTPNVPNATPIPTGKNASVNHSGGEASPMAERRGEVQIDKGADTDVLGGGPADPEKDAEASAQNIEDAKRDALANHDREVKRGDRVA